MMNLKFIIEDECVKDIIIEGADGSELIETCTLKDVLENSFKITNPAKAFADIMKNNGFDNMTEEHILTEAEAADLISNAWIVDNKDLTSLNVLMIIRNLAMMVLKDTKK